MAHTNLLPNGISIGRAVLWGLLVCPTYRQANHAMCDMCNNSPHRDLFVVLATRAKMLQLVHISLPHRPIGLFCFVISNCRFSGFSRFPRYDASLYSWPVTVIMPPPRIRLWSVAFYFLFIFYYNRQRTRRSLTCHTAMSQCLHKRNQ